MTSEFAVVEALLRQQNDFIRDQFDALKDEANGRFDRVESRMDRLETRLAAVEFQTTKTNGTVGRHTDQITSLMSGDASPLITLGKGQFVAALFGVISAIVGGIYAASVWVSKTWPAVVPALVGMVW